MHAKINSAAIHGIDAIPVELEIDIGRGLPGMTLLGLPDTAVREGRDRVRSALINSRYDVPQHKVTVNMAPAHVRKEGPAYDLALALGLLAATKQLPEGALERLASYGIVGELALDGRVRPIRGALAVAIAARAAGWRGLILPGENAAEAAAVDGVEAIPVATLVDAVAFAAGECFAPALPCEEAAAPGGEGEMEMAEVRGQAGAKRALLVAAAGAHNALLSGPPGAGKTMLARRLPGILPPLELPEALEVTRIWSIAGLLPPGAGIVRRPPFRAPHHTASATALVGGGWPPRPGEVTLAHRGVLFLDELPEFGQKTLDTLRQPIEEGTILVSRAKGTVEFPAHFLCIAAMNPCACGQGADPRRPCQCAPQVVKRYQARVSGPLRDRFDIQIDVPPVPFAETTRRASGRGPTSAALRAEVIAARGRQRRRGKLNGRLSMRELQDAGMEAAAEDVLRATAEAQGFSTRSTVRVLRVARTIADLAGEARIGVEHVAEAAQLRVMEGRREGSPREAAAAP